MIGQVFPTIIKLVWGDEGVTAGLAQAGQAAQKTDAAIGKLAGSFVNLAGAFTGIMVAGKVKDVISSIVTPAMDLSMTFMKLRALTGSNAEAMDKFKAKAFEVSKITPYGPQDVADALLKLRRASGSTEGALSTLGSTAQMAMASFDKISLEKSATMMGDMIKTFGMSGDEAARSAEKITNAANWAGLGTEEYSNILGKLGMAARQAGQSFDEILMAFTLARQVQPGSDRLGNELVRLMSEINRPEVGQAFRAVGVDIHKTNGRLKDFSQIMIETAKAWKDYGQMTKSALQDSKGGFGEASMKPLIDIIPRLVEGIRDSNGVVNKGAAVYGSLGAAIKQTGVHAKWTDFYVKELKGKVEILSESFTNIKLILGEAISGPFGIIVHTLQGLARVILAIVQNPVGKFLAGVVTSVVLGGAALWAFRAAWQGVGRILGAVNINLGGVAVGLDTVNTKLQQYIGLTVQVTAAERARQAASVGASIMGGIKPHPGFIYEGGAVSAAIAAATASRVGLIGRTLTTVNKGIIGLVGGATKLVGGWVGVTLIILSNLKEIKDGLISIGDWFGSKVKQASWYGNMKENVRQGGWAATWLDYILGGSAMKQLADERELAKKAAAESANKAKESAQAMREAAEKMRESLQFGGDLLNKAIDRIEKVNSYEPKLVQTKYATGMYQQLLGAGSMKGLTDLDRKMATNAALQIYAAEQIREESKTKKGGASPEDFAKMQDLYTGAKATAQFLSLKYGKGLIGDRIIKGYGKDFLAPLFQATGEQGRLWSAYLTRTAEGSFLNSAGGGLKGYDGSWMGTAGEALGDTTAGIYGDDRYRIRHANKDFFTANTDPYASQKSMLPGGPGSRDERAREQMKEAMKSFADEFSRQFIAGMTKSVQPVRIVGNDSQNDPVAGEQSKPPVFGS